MLKIKAYKEDILNALGDFLDEHFPLPENSGTAKKKRAGLFAFHIKILVLIFMDLFIYDSHIPFQFQ